MGYISEVAYFIEGSEQDMSVLLTTFRLQGAFTPAVDRSCWEELVVTPTGVYLHTTGKWYGEFESVKWHDTLFKLAEDLYLYYATLSGMFQRIGEEFDDIEVQYFGGLNWDRLQIHRTIEVNFPEAPIN